MPPKKYMRNNCSLIRRPARKSKPSDPQEIPNPVQESPPSTLIPPNPETPSNSTPNLPHLNEIMHQTLINGGKINSNVQDSAPSAVITPNLETPVNSGTNSAHSGEITAPVDELSQTLINGRKIESNVQNPNPVKIKEETLVEKEMGNDGAGDEKRVAETEMKNGVKKKKTKIVKRIVKRKVLRKVNHQTEALHQDLGNGIVGDVKIVSNECVHMDTESCVEGKVDCSLTEKLSKVSGLDFDATNKKTSYVTGTYLEDRIVNLRHQNHDCVVQNSLGSESGDCKQEEGVKNKLERDIKDCKQENGVNNSQEIGSKDDKQKEGVNNKEQCCDFGGMKAETSVGDTILSGEMGALERRRRRKTEIFVGGLDKDTREEDIRKIFEVLGELKDVTLVNSSKSKNNAFAFVRYTLAADAKKALIKYRKVEICGKLCGTSPVEGNDTLFLGNINKRWKSDDVTKLLQGIGIEKIDHVTVMSDPSNLEFNRGFAFLELESNKDAQNAYKKLQKKGVFGKHGKIKVAWAEPLIEPDESELNNVKSVYAEYLPSSWDEEKVKDCFKRFGDIENVALARDMPSSRRKDYAFVNYTTRDAALACVEAFSHEQTNDEGSKVKVKVSLAKPIPKGQQIKYLQRTPIKESKEKQKVTPLVKSLRRSRITGNLTSSNYDTRIVDQRSSMTSELVQLLREQASMRPTIPSLSTGFVNCQHPYPLTERKRPFNVQEDGSHFSDPRGHPRARVEGSYQITNPSVPIRGVSMTFLLHHQQSASYISRPVYGMERHPSYIQPRERAPYHGNIGTYQRY